MTFDVSLLPAQYLDYVLADLRRYLQKSEFWSHGKTREEDIVDFVRCGRMFLWVIQDTDANKILGYVVTEISEYPQCSMLTVQYCAGEPGLLEQAGEMVFKTLEQFAKDGGCAGVEFYGRKGWAPHVKGFGYHSNAIVFEKYFS